MTTESDNWDMLTRKANVIRERLENTLEKLDQKRHQFPSLPAQKLAEIPPTAVLGGALIVLGTGIGIAIYRGSHKEERVRHQRIDAAKRLWQHPDRAFQGGESMWKELERKLLVGTVSLVAMHLAKRALTKYLPIEPIVEPQAPLPESQVS